MNKCHLVSVLGIAALVAACNGLDTQKSSAVPASSASLAQALVTCNELGKQAIPDTSITLAQLNAAVNGVPEHCEIIGAINERVSKVTNQKYAIRFHLRLPTVTWNGRFLFMTQGGNDGNLGNNLGNDPNPISQGYATVSTDAGHDNAINTVKGDGDGANFGLDPQARLDYGYNADDQVTQKAKRLIHLFYGKDPSYSYLAGCSNGGRHAMVDGVRFPDYFDGILVGNPGFNFPRSSLAEVWDTQAYASIVRQKDNTGKPAIWTAFDPSDFTLVGDAVRKQCDALDGLADGMVNNFQACHFDPAVLQCKANSTVDCLSAEKVTVLKKIFGGPKNSKGEALYSDWPWDVGIATPVWYAWRFGNGNTGVNNSSTIQRGAAALPYVFMPQPVHGGDYLGFMLNFNFDTDAPKIYATSGSYSVSAVDFMTATTNITPFIQRGKKMIIYHGVSDQVFSVNDTIAWYNKVAALNGGVSALQRSIRLYPIPGMNHCTGGPATSQFDGLGALVNWVEKGEAPDRILATVPPERPVQRIEGRDAAEPARPASSALASLVPPGRTRPLCPFPQYAHYIGSGSIEEAANFVCK